MGVVKQELILVDNHGAGTHYVCGDQDGVEGPANPVEEFDEVGSVGGPVIDRRVAC